MASSAALLKPSNPNGGSRGLTEEQLAHALRQNGGNILATSQALGVTDSAIYQRLANHPHLKAIQLEANGKVTELAKARVIKRIERDDWPAVKFWLQTQGGWTQRHEITGANGAPLPAPQVNIQINYVGGEPEEPVL